MNRPLVRNNYIAIWAFSALVASIQPHIPRPLGEIIPRPKPREKTEEDHRRLEAAAQRRLDRARKKGLLCPVCEGMGCLPEAVQAWDVGESAPDCPHCHEGIMTKEDRRKYLADSKP